LIVTLPFLPCQLPDAILHGKRSYRPRSRAVRHLAANGLLSEAFQLAWAGVCATGLRTRQRHACETFSASSPLSARSATVFYGTFAWRHGSRLFSLRLPSFTSQRWRFYHRGRSERFHGSCRDRVSFPVRALILSRFSASFVWLTPTRAARVVRPC
jgi:hypothetical protein